MIAHELTYLLKPSIVLIQQLPASLIVKQEQEAFDGEVPLDNEVFLLKRIELIPA